MSGQQAFTKPYYVQSWQGGTALEKALLLILGGGHLCD